MRELVLGLAAVGIVVLWAAAIAPAKGTLPAGTPYAAEIRATVAYDGTYSSRNVFEQDCTDADGNAVVQQTAENESEHLDRTVLFKHITVPVVPPSALGKAARFLALSPTVTDLGSVTSDSSTYQFYGTQVTDNNPCPQVISPYSCAGTLQEVAGLVSAMDAGDKGFTPKVFQLPVRSVQVADPSGCSAIGINDAAYQLDLDAGNATIGVWGAVILHSRFDERFYELRKKKSIEYTVEVGPATSCQPQPPQLSCSQTVSGTAHVKIQRLFFYKTKKSYSK